MKLHVLNTGFFKLDGGSMFGVVPKSIWNKTNPADELNLCNWASRSLLIEDNERLILIDTALGDKQDEKFWRHYYRHGNDTLEKSLTATGFTPADVTDVFLTHLHFDHCGGCIKRVDGQLVPAFSNARYWSNRAHWDWATHPNVREKASFLKENILPMQEAGALNFYDEGHSPFSQEISVRYCNGHTKSMMLPQISYQGRTIVFMADLLPSVGHLPVAYLTSYDMFPMIALEEKSAFLEEALEKKYILLMQHDPVNECIDLQMTEKGIRMGTAFRLNEV